MKKDIAVIFGLFLLIAGLIIFGQGISTGSLLNNNDGQENRNTHTSVSIREMNINAKVANTGDLRRIGLSETENLSIGEGMIFAFDESGKYGIWMKDMNFAIDIVWIDKNKKVVHIVQNAPPEPGTKDDELTIYNPSASALYVLEVNAGVTALHGIRVGDVANFEFN